MEPKINPEFHNLIPPISTEEYQLLEQSILKEGCREKIITWEGWILDGHNRYEICLRHDIKFGTHEKSFENEDEVKEWIIRNQLARRNLSIYDRSLLALELKKILESKAKKKEELRKIISQTKSLPIDTTRFSSLQKAIVEVLSKYPRKPPNASPDKVYFVRHEGRIKIGCSSDIEGRLKDITKHLPEAKLLGFCDGGISLENELHKLLCETKLNNEWYELNTTSVAIIKAFIPKADFLEFVKVDSGAQAAKEFDVSEDTIRKSEIIEKEAPLEVKEAVRKGKMSVNKAYKVTRPPKPEKKTPKAKPMALEQVNAEIKKTFEAFYEAVRKARKSHWKDSPKEAVRGLLDNLEGLLI